MSNVFEKLKKEYLSLNYDLQVHAKMIIDITREISQDEEKIDMDIITVCAILHDSKNNEKEHAKGGAEYVKKVLVELDFSESFVNRVCKIISVHSEKPKTDDVTAACFYDADILCRFYALGILRGFANIASDSTRDWKKILKKVTEDESIENFLEEMKKKLQLNKSKEILNSKKEEYIMACKLLRSLSLQNKNS